MRTRGSGLLLFVVAVGCPALAAPRPVSLSWERDSSAQNCPDEAQMRQAVEARLGHAPFEDNADVLITARVEKKAQLLTGTIEVTRRDGSPLGRRELSSSTGDCAELAAAMQLAIAIAIDPRYLRRAPAAPTVAEVVPEPLPAVPVAPAAPVVPVAPAPSAMHFTAAVGALASVGLAPTVAAGATLRLALEWPRFSIGLDVRGDFASNLQLAGGGSLGTSVLLGAFSPCVRVWKLDACALVSVGALQVTSTLGGPEMRQSSPLILVGARAQLVLPLSEVLSLRPFFDAQAVLTRTSLLSGSETVWVTSPAVGALGLALGVRFF